MSFCFFIFSSSASSFFLVRNTFPFLSFSLYFFFFFQSYKQKNILKILLTLPMALHDLEAVDSMYYTTSFYGNLLQLIKIVYIFYLLVVKQLLFFQQN